MPPYFCQFSKYRDESTPKYTGALHHALMNGNKLHRLTNIHTKFYDSRPNTYEDTQHKLLEGQTDGQSQTRSNLYARPTKVGA